ncbi:hypothetical protein [Clostridium manihotivorum]|uniref:SAF domain-containing protein n=1 Tax=Clostridium manihotivorum TaxID=2320868 RepID=A0A3R5QUB9_9CLOT|nr:hypothetical protein [Clostridium manihotivorum]QAA32713.1 hypothetical protein C1I91_14310 [Clostridium manihotivorum]
MKKKVSLMFLSLLMAAIIFAVVITLQNKIANPNGKTEVYYSQQYISKNTIINKDNFDKYFIKREVSKDNLVEDSITNKEELLEIYTAENILKGEQISRKRIDKNSNRLKDIPNKVEYSIKFSDISEVAGGTLREGDVIDLILTENQDNKVITQTELKNVIISKAIAADGSLINRDSKAAASALNLYLSAVDAHKLDNAVERGKIKALKKLDSSTYDNISIENYK